MNSARDKWDGFTLWPRPGSDCCNCCCAATVPAVAVVAPLLLVGAAVWSLHDCAGSSSFHSEHLCMVTGVYSGVLRVVWGSESVTRGWSPSLPGGLGACSPGIFEIFSAAKCIFRHFQPKSKQNTSFFCLGWFACDFWDMSVCPVWFCLCINMPCRFCSVLFFQM